ncbi:Glyoxylate reductase [Lonchura striata]|uniref:Glyoxylate reductase/hydroxypyruvate reductase n=1 Tax=Lonchura striata TaxID=40157 RepID=A0A218UZD4_9PASE|nr:Glyoxylate reductase [Lonchura striata domestica]
MFTPNDIVLQNTLEQVVEVLTSAGFSLQEEKVQWMPSWKYLGLEVTMRTILSRLPDTFQQAKLSHQTLHQNVPGLVKQFKLKRDQAKAIVATCPHCKSTGMPSLGAGVNPQGLGSCEVWQTDVILIPEFGCQKSVIDKELLQTLPNLKVIVNSGVGMDHLDLKLVGSFGMKMANAPRAVSSTTAETGMALLLASARRLVEGMDYCEADILGVKVAGATLEIVGMGNIGYKIAVRAKAFEMNILYHNRTQRDHALLKLKNVIITPHLGIKTDKATYMITEEGVENILAALNVPGNKTLQLFRNSKLAVKNFKTAPGTSLLSESQQSGELAKNSRGRKKEKGMEGQELPYVLVDSIGGRLGVYEDHLGFLKKRFHLITIKEYLENKTFLSKKIRAIYIWYHKPAINEELLQNLPNLKVVASAGMGIDHLDLKLLSSYGVKVSNTPFIVSTDTADMGMALLLASSRRLVEGHEMAVSPDTEYFPADWLGAEVSGATLGILGMGKIGYKVAERAKAFEMKILYHNRNQRKKEEESAVGAVYCKKIDDLLQQSDFVLLAVNLTPQTHKLIGKRELELMKPTAILINISRGLVVDQDALVEALQNKVIKAAALDVTYPEPLPSSAFLFFFQGSPLVKDEECYNNSSHWKCHQEDTLGYDGGNGRKHRGRPGRSSYPS